MVTSVRYMPGKAAKYRQGLSSDLSAPPAAPPVRISTYNFNDCQQTKVGQASIPCRSSKPLTDKWSPSTTDWRKSAVRAHLYIIEKAKPNELTIENLYAALKKHGIKYPKIVLAQAILETGRFRSRVCNENNNLFGLRHSNGYYVFDHWEESVIAYKSKMQYKHRDNENYYAFLKRIGYSTSKDYVRRVREIVSQL